jgi:hypothetical protein
LGRAKYAGRLAEAVEYTAMSGKGYAKGCDESMVKFG